MEVILSPKTLDEKGVSEGYSRLRKAAFLH
jgi:hypothetical protein